MVEFLVIAVAILPLFLLMPMIAKYQDIAHRAQLASRYVAFDAMTRNDSVDQGWKPESQLANEVRERFFSSTNSEIISNPPQSVSGSASNPFWTDPAGASLIRSLPQDVVVSYGTGSAATHAAGFQGAHDGDPFSMKGPMSLQARGVYSANVKVTLARLPAGLAYYEPFDRIDLSIRRSTSVAVDTWTGLSPGAVQGKLGDWRLSPLEAVQGIVPITDFLVSALELPPGVGQPLGTVKGPQLGKLDFWQDVVPSDRLRK